MTATPMVSRARLPRGAGRDAAAPVEPVTPTVSGRARVALTGAARNPRFALPLALLLAVQTATLTAALTAAFPH